MSHTSLTYHIVFSTYKRANVINIAHERELYKYMYDFATKRGIKVFRIGGMPDHVHLLCEIPAKLAVADFVKLLKSETSKFMRFNPHFPGWQKWAEGYGAFTVESANRAVRIKYIMNQKAHHGTTTFTEEYRQELTSAGLSIDIILGDEQ